MNKVILAGNITKEPEFKTTGQGTSVISFTVATNRKYKDASGNYASDFHNCVAWRSTAEFIKKYFHKGSRIIVVGSVQYRSYDDKEGRKKYVTEIIVDEAEFGSSKADTTPEVYKEDVSTNALDEFVDYKPAPDEELPF